MPPRKIVVKRLDSVFSQYIRLKDAFMGDATCVTCGLSKPWKEMQAGHYESRGNFSTRWDEDNVHVQCVGCNVFKKGNYTVYARFMINKYGSAKLDELAVRAKVEFKVSTPDLLDQVEIYKKRVLILTKNN